MQTKEYAKWRAKGIPASLAYRWAQTPAPPALDWDVHGERATLEREGFTIDVRVTPDDWTDLSWLGEFTDDPEGAVRNPAYERDHYKYFRPAYSVAERRRDLSALGYAKGPAEQTAREQVQDDARKAVGLVEYVVIVTAGREGVELGSASLGGCDVSSSRDVEQTVEEHGLIEEAIAEARATLGKLCTSP